MFKRRVPRRYVLGAKADLSVDYIRQSLLQNSCQTIALDDSRHLRRAAVLVPIIKEDDWKLLFIRRSQMVQDHKGQVAFPGGVVEPGDPNPETTALREAYEEIGLQSGDVTILGRLPEFATGTNYLVTPVVGYLRWPLSLVPFPDEVDRIFTIPLHWLANRSNWEEKPINQAKGVRESLIYFKRYDGEQLWGVTARIVVQFLEILNLI